MKKSLLLSIFIYLLLFTARSNAQNLALYSFSSIEQSDLGFVSLSDNYPLSNNPDSVAIPDVKGKGIKSAAYFKLDVTYRKRFLSKTKIAETDRVFIYDYASNALVSFTVKSLNVVARLNLYADKDDWPYSQEDYMFGFEINKNLLKGFKDYDNDVLVYVGKENPFAGQKLKPVAWKKISSKDYPAKAVKKDPALQPQKYVVGNSYRFDVAGFQYFIQDYLSSNHIFARRLVVQIQNQKIIYEKVYTESEGVSLAPLNFVNEEGDNHTITQWTGKLFKNRAPVIFGFEYQSFGCPAITILEQPATEVYINCDNRH